MSTSDTRQFGTRQDEHQATRLLPRTPTPQTIPEYRQHLIAHLRQEEASEDTEQLIDWLTDAWATFDLLIERFGEARAWQLYTAQTEHVQGAPDANVT